MSVYVDQPIHPFGHMLMCHMWADTSDELHAMARAIGVARWHVQYAGTPREHYDVCKTKRSAALQAGAVEASGRDLVALVGRKRREEL